MKISKFSEKLLHCEGRNRIVLVIWGQILETMPRAASRR